MIIAVVVSIISAQGAVAQDEMADNQMWGYKDYEYEMQEYAEIGIVELPMSVEHAAIRDYEHLKIHKTFISKDNTYKIVLRGKNNNDTKVVFASAIGEWIRPNDKS